MTTKDMIAEVVKQYKQDKKVFKDEDFYLNNTVDNIFNRHDIYNDKELWKKVFEGALKELGKNVKVYVEEKIEITEKQKKTKNKTKKGK